MIANGDLTGKFWRVIDSRNDRLTITKYEYIVTVIAPKPNKIQMGDRISFFAQSSDKDGVDKKHWYATKIRVHGSSFLKFVFSIFSVLIVLTMTIMHFRLDAKTVSLSLKRVKG
jgi:hypothetical protein